MVMQFLHVFRHGLVMLLWLASACGSERVELPVTRDVNRILFIGNSITLHAPSAALGWSGSWGMAASAATTDYAHRLSARFPRAQHVEMNVSAFETSYGSYDLAALDGALAAKPDVVVVELGDNVRDVTGFSPHYEALIDRITQRTPAAVILCTSTWWRSQAINATILGACSRPNTRYVDISSFRADPSTWAASERSYVDAGVGQHPGDRGMQLIADALYHALR